MKALHSRICRAALLIGAFIGVPGIFGSAFAGDITQYANNTWLRAGYVWGTSEIVGCQPADPDGTACAFDDNSEEADDPPWTFESGPGAATITVVDGYVFGDQYAVYDHGVLIGVTSEAIPGLDACGEDPDYCLTTDASKGSFDLEPGPHSITMIEVTGNFMSGVLWFRVDGDLGIADSDGDGIPDDADACPESDLSPTVVVNSCDSTVANEVLADGCTITDLIEECFEINDRISRAYRCVKDTTNDLYNIGVIEWAERRLIRQCQ